MTRGTALERSAMVVHGVRASLELADGHVTITKESAVQAGPTTIDVDIGQIRGTTLTAPSRGGRGWLHVAVGGGSPPPPSELAAAGDPYTVPLTGRGVAAARKFTRMVDRHVRAHGLPTDTPRDQQPRTGSVVLTSSTPAPPEEPEEPRPAAVPATEEAAPVPEPRVEDADGQVDEDAHGPDLVVALRELADLHAAGALSDDEFERAKQRLLA
jgi:hypothetical protein